MGTPDFYHHVLLVAVPILIQNAITNFVGMLDNIMIGVVGTEQMSGISINNQLMLVFNLSIFGAISGAGIFGAQFYGKGDQEGVRRTFRFKIYACVLLTLIGLAVFWLAGEQLIRLYLTGEGDPASLEATLHYGKQYLAVMMVGLLPFAIEEVYAGTLRECGETFLPMVAGIVAIVVNLGLNVVLIFGYLGFPALGVVGAALATVISRFVQLFIVVFWTHTHKQRMPFIEGVFNTLKIPAGLAANICKKGIPLMCNEVLWAAGIAVLNQCYSKYSLDTVAALSISGTLSNLFNVIFIAMGSAISIMVGQLLGAGKLEEARDTDTKLIVFTLTICTISACVLAACAPFFPRIYKTTDEAKALATGFILISALCTPLGAFINSAYFTLRSGGKTGITFLFDSVFVWLVNVPLAYVLSTYTGVPILPMYFCCQAVDLIKCILGFILVKKGVWINRLVVENQES